MCVCVCVCVCAHVFVFAMKAKQNSYGCQVSEEKNILNLDKKLKWALGKDPRKLINEYYKFKIFKIIVLEFLSLDLM